MPISFILVGLLIIYMFFYKQNFKYRNLTISLLLLILVGFFVSEINILNGVLINVFIFIPILIFTIYFIVTLNKIEGLIFLGTVVLSVTIYILLVLNDIEFSTLFNVLTIFLITLSFSVLQSFSIKLSVAYSLSVFSMYEILNILLIKNSTGVITIFSTSTFSYVVYIIAISYLTNKFILFLKTKIKKEKEINA